MSKVREEVTMLLTELDHLTQILNSKSYELTRLRNEKKDQRHKALTTPHNELQELMTELRELQRKIQLESARVLDASEELDTNQSQLYTMQTSREVQRSETESNRRELEALQAEQEEISQMVERLRWENNAGEGRLEQLEQRQRQAKQWQHQLAEQEITDKGEADTMASDMALMEGLSALVPQLSAEIEETMLVVQSRNNMLRERMELAPMQELDAMERAGWGMANGEPYSEQALQRLAEEFTEVAGLQKQVEEGRRAMHTAEQDLARDMAAVGTETQKHVRAQETLKQQVEQQAIEVGELQERYSSVQRAQEAALALAARHR